MVEEVHGRFINELVKLIKDDLQDKAYAYAKHLAFYVMEWSAKEAKNNCYKAVWECKEFRLIYQNKCFNILQHLDVNSRVNDKTTITNILNGSTPKEIVYKSMYELAPNISQEHRDKVHHQSTVFNSVRTTNMYKCPIKNCGATRARFNMQQTKAADEAATIQLVCLECGKQWIV